MKALVIVIMLIALYLLYRIAYPKQPKTKQGDDTPRKREGNISEAVVKKRFVRPDSGLCASTHTTVLKTEYQDEKTSTFAVGNEKRDAVIPPEMLDEVFSEEPNPEDLDIEPDEDEDEDDDEDDDDEEPDLEEEAEELRQVMGGDAEMADGMTIEEMAETVEAIVNPTDSKARLLYEAEKTDMFEKLVSGDEGKAARIKAVIDRYIQNQLPQDESVESDKEIADDWKDFDVRLFTG